LRDRHDISDFRKTTKRLICLRINGKYRAGSGFPRFAAMEKAPRSIRVRLTVAAPTILRGTRRSNENAERSQMNHPRTWKGTLLTSVPLGVATWTFPVVAPAGTVVVISESETTVNVATVPLKLTLVAPVRFVPRISRAAPTAPKVGRFVAQTYASLAFVCGSSSGYDLCSQRPRSSIERHATPRYLLHDWRILVRISRGRA